MLASIAVTSHDGLGHVASIKPTHPKLLPFIVKPVAITAYGHPQPLEDDESLDRLDDPLVPDDALDPLVPDDPLDPDDALIDEPLDKLEEPDGMDEPLDRLEEPDDMDEPLDPLDGLLDELDNNEDEEPLDPLDMLLSDELDNEGLLDSEELLDEHAVILMFPLISVAHELPAVVVAIPLRVDGYEPAARSTEVDTTPVTYMSFPDATGESHATVPGPV